MRKYALLVRKGWKQKRRTEAPCKMELFALKTSDFLIMFLHEIAISWGITFFQKTFGQTDSDGECYTTGTSG